MKETLITPEHARQLARALFLDKFDDAGDWFDLAWEAGLEKNQLQKFGGEFIVGALGVSDRGSLALQEMARDFAVLFNTFLQKHPVTQEALIEQLEASCVRDGNSTQSVRRLSQALKRAIEPQAPFVIWSGNTSKIKVHCEYAYISQAESYLEKESEFDIFVHGQRVSIGGSNDRTVLALPARLRWLLIMLLRYPGKMLPVEESYKKAWGRINLKPEEDAQFIIDEYLRFAMSDLRRHLKPLGGFSIPGKDHVEGGYRCEGECSFCIILERHAEARVTLNII